MGVLNDYNIVIGSGVVSQTFEQLLEGKTFLDVEYKTPSDYVTQYWNAYQSYLQSNAAAGANNNNQNGKIFECILATLLVRENLVPYFLSAKIAFVPNVVYDITLFSREIGPISLSAKTSLRERYKQADLESIALKYVHRRAQAYLINNHAVESESVRRKIKSGDVIGLDDVVFAQSADFDELIAHLKSFELCHPGTVEIVTSNQMVTGKTKVSNV
jgi:hypothetical protein